MVTNIDDIARGYQKTSSGDLVGPERRKSAMRLIDYMADVTFAVGGGMTTATLYDGTIASNEELMLGVAGGVIASFGFSQRFANVFVRYLHNRGTYTSFLDFIKRV